MEENITKGLLREDDIPIKKVMRGFEPAAVADYINEMNRSMENASKNFEARMADMKQELTLTARERDMLAEKCRTLAKKDAGISREHEKELLSQIAALKNELEEYGRTDTPSGGGDLPDGETGVLSAALADKQRELESALERIRLLEQRAENSAANEERNSEIMRLEEQNSKLSGENAALKQTGAALNTAVEKLKAKNGELSACLDKFSGKCDALSDENEKLREENEIIAAENDALEEQLEKTTDENKAVRNENGRLTVENGLLGEKNARYIKEISELKAEAKTAAYTNAERFSAEAEALEREKLAIRKKAQLQGYHIELCRNALDELSKQLEEIKSSFAGEE